MAVKYPNRSQDSFPVGTGIVTLAEVKEQVSLFDDTSFDTMLGRMIVAATTMAGNYISQSLEAKDVVDYYDGWDSRMVLSETEVDSISSVVYTGTDNTESTVSSDDYILDQSGLEAAIVFTTLQTAELSVDIANPIKIEFTSLHTTAADNQAIKQAVLIMVADMFSERESNTEGAGTRKAHITAERLLSPYKRYHV